ncbi:hypothetical protein C8Q75DRAFT_73807 [Abortiporus biennis]|nr:hypothetical protein C8Q75DRAFT_73807 [Abortiporus biennis]
MMLYVRTVSTSFRLIKSTSCYSRRIYALVVAITHPHTSQHYEYEYMEASCWAAPAVLYRYRYVPHFRRV